MTDTLNLIEVAVTEGLIIELDFDDDDKRLEWAPLNIAKRVMPVITAAMAQDKARIAELEEALGLLVRDCGYHLKKYRPAQFDLARQALAESPSHDQ